MPLENSACVYILQKILCDIFILQLTMTNSQHLYQEVLTSIFRKSVESVKPKILFQSSKCMQINGDDLYINDGKKSETINIGGKQCHLVGFGKAVLGMSVQIERILGDRLKSAIISVPFGTVEKFKFDMDMQLGEKSCIQIFEGAQNNLPDEAAENTAKKMLSHVKLLNKNDVLIVVISGGGSALIPLPIPSLSLVEKRNLIQQLTSKEATINELNAVRIALSQIKGGKLAEAGENAHRIISLIISDVIGDPLDIIASGPTISTGKDTREIALAVLKRYNIFDTLSEVIRQTLASNCTPITLRNSNAFIIGNNKLAMVTAKLEAEKQGFQTICLSTKVQGNVEDLSKAYVQLIQSIYDYRLEKIETTEFQSILKDLNAMFDFSKEVFDKLPLLVKSISNQNPICLIAGGEPTVCIQGNGIGGRNQELVLRVTSLLANNASLINVLFLAAGTDGIDGPTNAAGAIGSGHIIEEFHNAIEDNISVNDYIKTNDSFNFFRNLKNGKYHIITGHTGTNVMDLHMIVIPVLKTSY